jgi:hypothetical protein
MEESTEKVCLMSVLVIVERQTQTEFVDSIRVAEEPFGKASTAREDIYHRYLCDLCAIPPRGSTSFRLQRPDLSIHGLLLSSAAVPGRLLDRGPNRCAKSLADW